MKKIVILTVWGLLSLPSLAQETKPWSEADRKYLIDNLTRSRDELIKETEKLTEAQWRFRESQDRWSINEVTEHIGIWELLLMHDISKGLTAGPQPTRTPAPDSIILNFLNESKPHYSMEYTKPFTYTMPTGLDEGKNNVTKVLKYRNQQVGYLKDAHENLRSYFRVTSSGNIHQAFIVIFAHADRHLRQIRKIKQHPNYPK